MEHIAEDHGASFTRAGIDALLHPNEEDDVVESVSFKELGQLADGLEGVFTEEPEQDVSPETDVLYTVKKEPKDLVMDNVSLAHFGFINRDSLFKLRGS